MSTRFEDLPILLDDMEYKDGWQRNIQKQGAVSDLLEIWDIDDPSEKSAIVQVLRHLRSIMSR